MRKHPLLALASIIALTALAILGEGFTATPKAFSSERQSSRAAARLAATSPGERRRDGPRQSAQHFVVLADHQGLSPAAFSAHRHRTRKTAVRPAGGVWASLRNCESGGNYRENSGNGYYGAYQFAVSTWRSIGYGGVPSAAPFYVQDQAAKRLESARGWQPWPVCSRMLNL